MTLARLNEIRQVYYGKLSGIVWRTVCDPDRPRLYLECRDHDRKRVSFYAFSLEEGRWLWEDIELEETWWMTLAGVWDDVLLLTAYHDTNNPDQKSLFAFDADTREPLWFRNNFALTSVAGGLVYGNETRTGYRPVWMDVRSGREQQAGTFIEPLQNFELVRPFQYQEGTDPFTTVSTFLQKRRGIRPVITIEYSEYESFVIISAFEGETDLANYLIVLNSEGEIVLEERLGEHLKGIALDSFFVLSGFLIFVKNKTELAVWRFV